jgi:zinc protease
MKSGVALLTADLLESGTTTRNIVQIAERLEFLGSSLSVQAGVDATYVSIVSLTRCAEESIELLSDVVINPEFPASEFERVRDRHLTTILQRKDRAGTIAALAFLRQIYGDLHPYAYDGSGTEHSMKAITRDDVLRYYTSNYGPDESTLITAGDISLDRLVPILEQYFASWKPGIQVKSSEPDLPDSGSHNVFLIDKPGAPQSEIRMGYPALSRSTPDYFAVTVMNRILGGQFSSRINMNLRERRGYTYGARSSFFFMKYPGPFMVSGAFVTAKTDSAVEQVLAELDTMRKEGVTDSELNFSKTGLIGSFPLGFESPSQIAGALQNLVLYRLPDDYYDSYLQNVERVSLSDVQTAAARHLRPADMKIVIVGDVSRIKEGMVRLGLGEIVQLNSEGERVGQTKE